ncbi:hypothetical protein ACU4GI_33335 [Cupriavidus basilensis]
MQSPTINPDEIGLFGNKKTAAEVLVELVHERRRAANHGPDQDPGLAAERLRAIQLAGATAAMFGGLAAQQKLFAEVQAIDPDAANGLDRLWDFVGAWLS